LVLTSRPHVAAVARSRLRHYTSEFQ
jgi:hypothetical protein